MNFLNDIWNHIHPVLDWGIVLMIIVIGYSVRFNPLFTIPLKNRVKIILWGIILGVPYAIFANIDPGKFILSFVLAFGVHGIVLHYIEKLVKMPKSNNNRTVNPTGPPPKDRPNG